MKKDRLIVLTDAVLAIIMTILILELENQTTPSLEAFGILRQNSLLFLLSFSGCVIGKWMAPTHYKKVDRKISSEIIWWNLISTLGAAGVLFGEFHAIQDTSLNDVVDRIYINVKDLPFQSLGALANILSDVKKGLIQDSHIWSFFQSFFKQYQLIISLNQIYQFVYLSLMEIMSYLHFDYWKKRLGQELV